MGIRRGPSIVKDGLVLCFDAALPKSYPLSGNTWYDLSGDGNNGTINGATFDTNSRGVFDFNGSSNYVNCGNLTVNTSSLSLNFWVLFNVLTGGSYYTLFSFGGFVSNGFLFQRSGDSNKFRFAWGGTDYYDSVSFTETGVWNNFCVVINSGVPQYLYINGVANSFSRSFGNNSFSVSASKSIEIARRTDTLAQYVNGKISNLGFYVDKSLSLDEVKQNYEATRGRFESFSPCDIGIITTTTTTTTTGEPTTTTTTTTTTAEPTTTTTTTTTTAAPTTSTTSTTAAPTTSTTSTTAAPTTSTTSTTAAPTTSTTSTTAAPTTSTTSTTAAPTTSTTSTTAAPTTSTTSTTAAPTTSTTSTTAAPTTSTTSTTAAPTTSTTTTTTTSSGYIPPQEPDENGNCPIGWHEETGGVCCPDGYYFCEYGGCFPEGTPCVQDPLGGD